MGQQGQEQLQRLSKSTLMKLDLHVNKTLAVRFDDAQCGCFIADATAMRHSATVRHHCGQR